MFYPPLQCSAVMSWHAASIASWRDIWSCGRWSKTFNLQAHKISSMGLRKGEYGTRKRDFILEWVSNQAVTALGWWYATLFHAIIYWQVVWSPTCPLFLVPVFGTDLLKSHIYALFHTRSAQRDPLLLYFIWPCD